MSNKDLIIEKLTNLKNYYDKDESKKWGSRAISSAISAIKKYNGTILSGSQLQNDIKGIGEKISKRIDEILLTGNLKELENVDENNENKYIENILEITGVGLVRAKKWVSMGIKDVNDLKKAIDDKLIKSTHHIDIGIKYYYDLQKKIPRKEIDDIKIILNKSIKKVDNDLLFEICGSYRRGTEESGDIDVLISHPKYITNIDEMGCLEKVVKELKKTNFVIDSLTFTGKTKFMGICKLENSIIARRIDIRVVNYENYYTSILYFTGNKNFNVYLRNKALENKYSLNEYYLTNLNDNTLLTMKNEKEIFDILKINYLDPVDRNFS
jgi:DNA polymerase/3'-5' exonuclease PolX